MYCTVDNRADRRTDRQTDIPPPPPISKLREACSLLLHPQPSDIVVVWVREKLLVKVMVETLKDSKLFERVISSTPTTSQSSWSFSSTHWCEHNQNGLTSTTL
jgi:hypothetical protein